MQKNGYFIFVIGILLGWIASAGGGFYASRFPVALGGTVSGGDPYTLATGQIQGGDGDALFLWESARKKLAVYVVKSDGALELIAVRNCWFELEIPHEFSLHKKSNPSVLEMEEKLRHTQAARKTN